MAKPVYTLDQIKQRLDGDATWGAGAITFALPDSSPPSGAEAAGFQVLDAGMKSMASLAFELWDDLIVNDISLVSGSADITFAMSSTTGNSTYSTQQYSSFDGSRWQFSSAEVWLASQWDTHDQGSDITYGSYGLSTYLHEIGHALGLDHPGDYNGSADYATDAVYKQDTRRYTVMSYFAADADGSDTFHFTAADGFIYASTPMLHDIAAIQSIYGADTTTRTGNTTYGFQSNAGRDLFNFAINTSPILAIWDAGGTDRLNLSGYSAEQRIDLRAGTYSDVGGLQNNLAIAFGVMLENATGGSGTDRITGNTAANTINGLAGADVIQGLGGNDVLAGGGGADKLYGGDGLDQVMGGAAADQLFGNSGADRLTGGAGNDVLNGGLGIDVAVFSGNQSKYRIVDTASGVTVTAISGGDGIDTLIGIEKLVFADHTLVL